MYAIHKAEQELAVANGLSDSRGRPATIPSVPRWPAATWNRGELRPEQAVFANNHRAKTRQRKGLPFGEADLAPGSGSWLCHEQHINLQASSAAAPSLSLPLVDMGS